MVLHGRRQLRLVGRGLLRCPATTEANREPVLPASPASAKDAALRTMAISPQSSGKVHPFRSTSRDHRSFNRHVRQLRQVIVRLVVEFYSKARRLEILPLAQILRTARRTTVDRVASRADLAAASAAPETPKNLRLPDVRFPRRNMPVQRHAAALVHSPVKHDGGARRILSERDAEFPGGVAATGAEAALESPSSRRRSSE